MSADEQFLHQALDLARAGIGLASPNPYVGAVIVNSQGVVVGKATYTYAGVKHAEILALEQAGNEARGGTLFINLEPHAHQGRTPPCTDALLAAGIRRVVASMTDPNPKVSGRGFEQLRNAGVAVEIGALEKQARSLNEAFARYVRHGVPMVTLKSAMTLDAKIAPARKNSTDSAEHPANDEFSGSWITGEAARAHVHQFRHQNDAILIGIGTVLADNPLLTDRSGLARRRPLLRVVLDSRLRLPLESRLVHSIGGNNDLLVFFSHADMKRKTRLEECGVRVEQLPSYGVDGHVDLSAVLRRLGELEVTSVIIEGGSAINSSALRSGLVDKVFLFYAPTILGEHSVSFVSERGSPHAFAPRRLDSVRVQQIGGDVAFEGYLRDPYGE